VYPGRAGQASPQPVCRRGRRKDLQTPTQRGTGEQEEGGQQGEKRRDGRREREREEYLLSYVRLSFLSRTDPSPFLLPFLLRYLFLQEGWDINGDGGASAFVELVTLAMEDSLGSDMLDDVGLD